MLVTQKQLIQEVSWATRFAHTSTIIPILQNLLLECSGNRLTITATDLQTAGRTAMDIPVSDEWRVAVPAKVLLKYLKTLDSDEVHLSANDADLWVCQGGSEATIPGAEAGLFPELPHVTAQACIDGFATAVPKVLTSVGKEDNRFCIEGALMEVSGAEARLVSTDGHRLGIAALRYTPLPDCDAPHNGLIPTKALSEIAKFGDDGVRFGSTKDYIVAQYDNRSIIARKLTGSFPDYNRIVPSSFSGYCRFSTERALTALSRVALFCNKRVPAAEITITDKEMKITAKGDDGTGRAIVPLDMVGGDLPFTFGMSVPYLTDALRVVDGAAVLAFTRPHKAMAVMDAHGWKQIIMPVRLFDNNHSDDSVEEEEN